MLNDDELALLKQKAGLGESSHLSLKVRLREALQQLIEERVLQSGLRLPPSREFARSLGVSRETVEFAYSELQARGLLLRRTGVGSFVAEQNEPFNPRRFALSGRLDLEHLMPSMAPTQSRRSLSSIRVATPMNPVFAPGLPDIRHFPAELWEKLNRQVLAESSLADLRYGDPLGVASLRQMIAQRVQTQRGGEIDADNVVIVNSTRQALSLCAYVMADPGETVSVAEACWPAARDTFLAAQLTPEYTPVPADDLSATGPGKILYVTPSAQFTTGRVMPLEQRKALLQKAKSSGSWIIEDDYSVEFRYDSSLQPSIHSLDSSERTAYIGTFSETLFPDLRIAFVIAPPQLTAAIAGLRAQLDGFSSQVRQLVLARYIEAGHYFDYVRTMRQLYRVRRDTLVEAISRTPGGLFNVSPPQAGLNLECRLLENAAVTKQQIAKLGAQYGLVPLTACYNRKAPAGWLLGFASMTPGEIENTISRITDQLINRL